MMGTTWYFVSTSTNHRRDEGSVRTIREAKIIGETPRKWILREAEQIAEEAAGAERGWRPPPAPGEGWYDWTIPKKGGGMREARTCERQKTYTRPFFESLELAQAHLANLEAQAWASKNNYKIARVVETCTDATVMRQIAELVGWKEQK